MNYEIFRNEYGLYLYRGSERSVDQKFILILIKKRGIDVKLSIKLYAQGLF